MYKIFVAPIAKTSLTAPAKFFISHWSVKNDTIAILPIRFAQDGFISYSEWAHSNELICKKFKLHIDEEIIDGRSKEAKELQHFSWLTVIKMYAHSSNYLDEMQFKEFFNFECLLDKSSLKTGTKHIQLIPSACTKSKNWLIDATYLGNDNKVYFLLSSLSDNEIKTVSFQKMQIHSILAVAEIIKSMIAQGCIEA